MVFIGHFLILLIFVLILYLLANYSSLRYEIKELIALQTTLKTLADSQQRAYYTTLYNENVAAYDQRKGSPFSRLLILCFPDLDQSFAPIQP